MKQMNEMFEGLRAGALTGADGILSQIAESEQRSGAENARITAAALEKAGLTQTKHRPVQHKKRLRMFAAVAAAAVMLAGAAVGISAYVGHNQDMTQSRFGAGCETAFEALTMQDPVSADNGRARVTLEGCANDGIRQMLLVSYEAEPGTEPLDLFELQQPEFRYADGTPFRNWTGSAYEIQTQGDSTKLNKFYYEYDLNDAEMLEGQTLTMTFPKWEYGDTVHDDLTGIEIPVQIRKNTDAAAYAAENGDTLLLSGFELIRGGTEEDNPLWRQEIALIMTDGTRRRAFSDSEYGTEDGPHYAALYAEKHAGDWDGLKLNGDYSDNPRYQNYDYMGWFDTETIAAVELDGVVYSRVK